MIHALQHQSFIAISVLVWLPALEPARRRVPGALWKAGHIIGARTVGMFLGMAFIIMRSPAYPLYAESAPEHGLTGLQDQQIAGAMMLTLDVLIVFVALGYFFWRSAEDHDRAEALERARARSSVAPRRSSLRAGGRRKLACPRAALKPTSASSDAAPAALSTFRRRFSRAASCGVWGEGVLPSSSGTAPSGALRAKRTPSIAVATPVTTTAASAASLPLASARSRPDSALGRASFMRAPTQPATTATSEAELIQP